MEALIKQEVGEYVSPPPVMKQEYYGGCQDQMPHSTVVDHRRLGLDQIGRSKPKPPKHRPVSFKVAHPSKYP